MQEVHYYICEKCNKEFENQIDCVEHEKQCIAGDIVKLKKISIDHFDKSTNSVFIDVKIYNASIYKPGFYNLNDSWGSLDVKESDFCFENISPNNTCVADYFILWTKNLEHTHEKRCIEKLIDNYVCKFQKQLERDIRFLDFLKLKNKQIKINSSDD